MKTPSESPQLRDARKLLHDGDPAGAAALLYDLDFAALRGDAQTHEYLSLVRRIRNDYKLVQRFAHSMGWNENDCVTLKLFESEAVRQISDDEWLASILKSAMERSLDNISLHVLLIDDLANSAQPDLASRMFDLIAQDATPAMEAQSDGLISTILLAPGIEELSYLRNRILLKIKGSPSSPLARRNHGRFHDLLASQQYWQMQASHDTQKRTHIELLQSCSIAISLPRIDWWEKFRRERYRGSPTEIGGVQYYLIRHRRRLYAISWRFEWLFLSLPEWSHPFLMFLEPGRWLLEALHSIVGATKVFATRNDSFIAAWRKKILRHGIVSGGDLRSLTMQLQFKRRGEG